MDAVQIKKEGKYTEPKKTVRILKKTFKVNSYKARPGYGDNKKYLSTLSGTLDMQIPKKDIKDVDFYSKLAAYQMGATAAGRKIPYSSLKQFFSDHGKDYLLPRVYDDDQEFTQEQHKQLEEQQNLMSAIDLKLRQEATDEQLRHFALLNDPRHHEIDRYEEEAMDTLGAPETFVLNQDMQRGGKIFRRGSAMQVRKRGATTQQITSKDGQTIQLSNGMAARLLSPRQSPREERLPGRIGGRVGGGRRSGAVTGRRAQPRSPAPQRPAPPPPAEQTPEAADEDAKAGGGQEEEEAPAAQPRARPARRKPDEKPKELRFDITKTKRSGGLLIPNMNRRVQQRWKDSGVDIFKMTKAFQEGASVKDVYAQMKKLGFKSGTRVTDMKYLRILSNL